MLLNILREFVSPGGFAISLRTVVEKEAITV
jgi:hypothetical protein